MLTELFAKLRAGADAEWQVTLDRLEAEVEQLGAAAADREAAAERAEHEAERVRYLAHAGEQLSSTTDPLETLRTLARLAVPRLADWAAVDLFVEGPRVERLAVAHVDPAKVALVEELTRRYPPNLGDPADGLGQILRGGAPQLVPELPPGVLEAAAKDPEHLALMRSLGLRSYVCVPVASRGRVRGALTLIAAESGRRFGPPDLDLALDVARRAAVALEVAEVMAELRAAGERLRQLDRRKDEFIAMLGHELRNPLAAIASASELLAPAASRDPLVHRARDVISRQVAHTRRMVDDLLDVARLTEGKLEIERRPVDLTELLNQAVADKRPAFEQAGLSLELRAGAEPCFVEGDPTRLTQVITNLLQNARKFTPRGGKVKVQLEAVGSELAVEVRDDGVGVDPAALPDLFQPFVQERRVFDRSEGGLGLGLALARRLLERHGGTLTAASEGAGRGSTFTVRLPRRPAPAPQPATRAAAPTRRLKVLLVEDDLDGGEMMETLVESLGHDVELVRDGQSAIERGRALAPEIVLCDIGLPGDVDGYAVARALAALEAPVAPLLVAVTGFGGPEHRRRAEEAGFARVFVKPIDVQALEDLLAAAAARG